MNQHRRRGAAISVAAALTLLSGLASPALDEVARAEEPYPAECPWMNTQLTAEERADLLLDASTQHQKYRWLNEHAANSPMRTTFGQTSAPVSYPAQVGCTPTVVYANGAEGVHGKAGTTAWPSPIAIAATFNEELNETKAAMQGSEAFDSGNAVILGPGMAGGRTPLSGRTPEYFGEDPVLSGVMGAAAVRGLEDGNLGKGVIANPKHFVANEQEWDRQSSSSNMDERTLQEFYVLPYEIAVRESDPDSVMCSYNQINGTWACEHPIMNEDLKDRIGFKGYVMSDFGAVHSTADALNAGLDQELNRPIWFTPEKLDAALAAGEITQQAIDEAAFRVVRAYINVGLFDNPVPSPALTSVSTEEHKAVARELAEQSTVLLKNADATLPLTDGLTVAVIGQTASLTPTDGVSATTACAAHFRFRNGPILNCDALVDPLTALTERIEATGGEVVFSSGADLSEAAEVAAAADVAVVFGHIRMGEFADIPDLNLDLNGDALVSAVAAAAERTVVVLNSGTAVAMPWLADVDAVLHGWYGGEQFGPALAGILLGDVNPSGKLPMTFPESLADTPTSTEDRYPGIVDETGIRQVDYAEGLSVGYRWYEAQDIDPLFAFGHGLSYTTFEYSKVNVTPKNSDGSKAIRVSFRLTNTGDTTGTEVAQVYADLPESADLPSQRLVGWERVTLEPGEHRNVTVELTPQQLADRHLLQVWDEGEDGWVTPAGTVSFRVGGASDALSAPAVMALR
ncbi:glycosyl hydrolase [Tessaracoccus lapidicaptus]|uniref:Glycosyl hydrolase n=1 Tax=Tessaracoccus lapidicaptus TaxID=1427523 RepID=A0A1C0AR06_9ACTN|nr:MULTISPECIES: glycoside hydrolase family 3 C-terminal domain-containing protein [Tessaracoccus]AQX15074.1 glycosyl hydrolase [Tessaracoccus sp. T2.5-30]OCL36615.1 glycosyl hydrolase [Tessaracoccus lapidicaptus]VEP39263.1 Thermostable beta-glucosidase B [Tessaracoccus lapidicaptus]